MYDSFADFLISFSNDFPILWAVLVMVFIGVTGLALYGFWELVLRAVAKLSGIGNEDAESNQG